VARSCHGPPCGLGWLRGMSESFLDLGLAPGFETERIRVLVQEAQSVAGQGAMSVPIGDDAAAFTPPQGHDVVVSSDASVEEVHFRREWMTWETIGYRAVAAALSDLAAMAATPIGILLSVALPPELGVETSVALGHGVGEALHGHDALLLGGDLVASPGPVFLDVTVLGHAANPLRRNGVSLGDEVWVTGTLGGAAATIHDFGVQMEPHPDVRKVFERPCPRLTEARWLVEHLNITAAIDVSDGLLRDARHLAMASGLAIQIDFDRVPTLPPLESIRKTSSGAQFLLAGGEDYEFLFTAPAGSVNQVAELFKIEFGIEITQIGHAHEGVGVSVYGLDVGDLVDGFDHFGLSM